MLIGIAIGDAFGKDYENKSRSEISKKFNYDEYRKDKPIYTDDTQTTLAVAELMDSKYLFNEKTLASNLILAYRRDKRAGYSSRTKGIIEKTDYPKEYLFLITKPKKLLKVFFLIYLKDIIYFVRFTSGLCLGWEVHFLINLDCSNLFKSMDLPIY